MSEKECYGCLNVRLILTTIKHKSTGRRNVQIQFTYRVHEDLELRTFRYPKQRTAIVSYNAICFWIDGFNVKMRIYKRWRYLKWNCHSVGHHHDYRKESHICIVYIVKYCIVWVGIISNRRQLTMSECHKIFIMYERWTLHRQ